MAFFVGLDWAATTHAVCVLDETGTVRWRGTVPHTAAGLTERGVHYWKQAGQQASDRSAFVEATRHFNTAIELLKTLPDTPARAQEELALHVGLGAALIVTKELRILGSLSGRAKAYWKALTFLSAHQRHIPFERMLSNEYSLDEVNTAMLRMKGYQEIKPIIRPFGAQVSLPR